MSNEDFVQNYCLPFATSLFGAFLGALSAYWVGRFQEGRDEQNRQHTALIEGQYALYSQWGVLEDMRKHHLEPVRNDPKREQHQKIFQYRLGHLTVPFDKLAFIINTSNPNLLQEIHLAEQGFLAAMHALEKANEKRNAIQTRYKPENFNSTTGQAVLSVPQQEAFELKALTNLLYEITDKALPRLKKVNEEMFEFIKAHFRGRLKGMKTVPIPTDSQKEVSKLRFFKSYD